MIDNNYYHRSLIVTCKDYVVGFLYLNITKQNNMLLRVTLFSIMESREIRTTNIRGTNTL